MRQRVGDVSDLWRSRATAIWFRKGVASTLARTALRPISALFSAGVSLRNLLYDRGLLVVVESPLPTLSVGNLSVGGTGKTPVAAFFAAELRRRGRRPAIVLRGYGGDEEQVHALLNPGTPVIVSPDRVAGVKRAAALGADVVVLDDAFQHRRAGRVVDIVLVSADRWAEDDRLLPAGPLREPLRSIRRASLALVTVKSAAPERVAGVRRALQRIAPALPVATAHLRPCELVCVADRDLRLPIAKLAGQRILAVAAIADPAAFVAQLRELGATVDSALFGDHHAFTPKEVRRLVGRAAAVELAVCTLKDAVKLRPLWPADGAQLWYVSQAVEISDGLPLIHESLTSLLSAK